MSSNMSPMFTPSSVIAPRTSSAVDVCFPRPVSSRRFTTRTAMPTTKKHTIAARPTITAMSQGRLLSGGVLCASVAAGTTVVVELSTDSGTSDGFKAFNPPSSSASRRMSSTRKAAPVPASSCTVMVSHSQSATPASPVEFCSWLRCRRRRRRRRSLRRQEPPLPRQTQHVSPLSSFSSSSSLSFHQLSHVVSHPRRPPRRPPPGLFRPPF
mmetsp:Transcript_6379/g.16619  ORF Transcript_6379/g.16619 Transcript_6379/m.16619 type:complete len:211 (+) Transcript_6379:2968-3600(+)